MTDPAQPKPVLGRTCGECSLCCKLLSVDEISKPTGTWCRHYLKSKGCSIYEQRPEQCRDFMCGWLSHPDIGDEWSPRRSKMVLFADRHVDRLGVHVDPGSPTAWRREPYFSQLKQWARENTERQQQVVVYVRDRAIVILPDKEVDVGIVTPGDAIFVTGRPGNLDAVRIPESEVPIELRGRWTTRPAQD
jgi:hypothetical protein